MVKRNVRKNCPYCSTPGIATSMHNETDTRMRCPVCKEIWYSRSGICPDCNKPNGYVSDSPCAKCYEIRLKRKHRNAV